MDNLSLYQQGVALMEIKDFGAALELFNQSAQMQPHFKTFEYIGECLVEMKRYREAVLYFAAAGGLGNKQSRPYFLLAKCLIEIGNAEGAREKLDLALQYNPSFKMAKELLVSITRREERDDKPL